MTQYNTLNIKLSNSQLNKLKLGIKNGANLTLKLLTITKVSSLCKALAKNSSGNIKLLKT